MNNNETDSKKESITETELVESRRSFLKKSTYAAYATPALTSLLINNAAAKNSFEKNPNYPL